MTQDQLRFSLVSAALAVALPGQTGLWAELPVAGSALTVGGCAAAFDASRGRLVAFAGGLNSTWEFNGEWWIDTGQQGPADSSQVSVEAVYDSQRQVVVAVRGISSSQTTETWEWDGFLWQQVATATMPPGRFDFALAYDSVRGVTVMYGGLNGSALQSDTWEFDGVDWMLRTTGGPPARQGHAMTFDVARSEVVLFGGHSVNTYLNLADTWRWNGIYWVQDLVVGPVARSRHLMTYDEARQRVVMHGGRVNYNSGVYPRDVWEWDGLQWTSMTAAPPDLGAALEYDPVNQRVLLIGGHTGGVMNHEVWGYTASTHLASVQSFGVGCPGPQGVPLLATAAVPRLGDVFSATVSNLPTGALNLPLGFLGFNNQHWNGVPLPVPLDGAGFPGCFALLGPEQSFLLATVPGTVNWDVEVPFLPAFLGEHFYLQAGVLVLGFNPGGVVFSNGLDATVGV